MCTALLQCIPAPSQSAQMWACTQPPCLVNFDNTQVCISVLTPLQRKGSSCRTSQPMHQNLTSTHWCIKLSDSPACHKASASGTAQDGDRQAADEHTKHKTARMPQLGLPKGKSASEELVHHHAQAPHVRSLQVVPLEHLGSHVHRCACSA